MPEVAKIEKMFSAIAPRYDLLNHFLSFNIDRVWRKKLIRFADQRKGAKILDLCTGTGDIALEFLRNDSECQVTGLDLSQEMLNRGAQKAKKERFGDRLQFLQGNAMELPFRDGEFDYHWIWPPESSGRQ